MCLLAGVMSRSSLQQHLQEMSGVSTCCSPTELGPLDMTYVNSDDIVIHVRLPNIIVKSCDCRAALQVRNVTSGCRGGGGGAGGGGD